MQAMEVYALGGAVALGVLALLHFVVWRGQRLIGSACFAAGYAVGALVYLFDRQMQPAGGMPNLLSTVLGMVSFVLLTVGLVRYVDLPQPARRTVTAVAIGAALVLVAGVALGVVGRLAGFTVFAGFLGLQAGLALWAMRREPGHGHALVFAALMLYPAWLGIAWAGWVEVSVLRYAVIIPVVTSGATLLTTGLLRAQRIAVDELERRRTAERALQALNDTLEQRVAQRTAELRDMVAGLESFNRSVSHDLRGPLGGIAGVSRLALSALAEHDTATVQRLLSAIAAQAESSAQLVTDLLALARVGDAQLAPQPIELTSFVRDTLQLMRASQPEAGAPPVEVGELPVVEADPGLLRQVYVNLLGNAIKFSRNAQAPHIEVGAFARDGEQVCYVRDNGVGFDAKQAEGLFQPFRRLHGQSFAGHGVGLSIVKRIIERHGGKLWAQAQPNAGATFFFSLPRSAAQPAANASHA